MVNLIRGKDLTMSTRALRLAFAVFLALGWPSAAFAADVTGNWDMTVNAQQPLHWKVTFKQEGETVTGRIRLGTTQSAKVLDIEGTVKDNHIEFTFNIEDLGGNQPFNLEGEIDGGQIKGKKAHLWNYGEGDWTAQREAASK